MKSLQQRSTAARLPTLPRSFFCHFISSNMFSACSKNSATFEPCSSRSAVLKMRTLVSRVRYSHISGMGKTICSIVRSCRTICSHSSQPAEVYTYGNITKSGNRNDKSTGHYLDLSRVVGIELERLVRFRVTAVGRLLHRRQFFVVLSQLVAQNVNVTGRLFFRAVLVKDGLLVVAPTDHVHQLANALFLNSNRRAVVMSSPLDSLLAMQFWFS